MRTLVVGAGPAGLVAGAALAARGHTVVAVDRDPGPAADGTWERRGVMQFAHAHGFRPQVAEVLQRHWPAAYDAWLALGAEPVTMTVPAGPGSTAEVPVGTRSRRATFERALRAAAAETPGLALRTGHVDRLLREKGRVAGAVVDGEPVAADLVVDASGRAGRVDGTRRTLGSGDLGGACGISYVDRVYRLRAGAQPGPLLNPVVWAGSFDGYQTLVFMHEAGYFSLLFVRPTADDDLAALRHRPVFEAACRAVPALAEWTDLDRAAPASEVMVGGALRNSYRAQERTPGLVAVGDAVTTTTPTAGRGVAMTCLQVQALLGLLDDGADVATVAEPFDAWCAAQMRPWVEDHVVRDTEAVWAWQGADVDLSRPLSSTRILDAAQVDPRISAYAGPFQSMTVLPDALAPAEPLARAVYETGWRPAYTDGPTRDQLVDVIAATRAA
jgi:2-polyprenyl-6-methoxyphenol hydroxylase-like FAD-dependent oxidoreductase